MNDAPSLPDGPILHAVDRRMSDTVSDPVVKSDAEEDQEKNDIESSSFVRSLPLASGVTVRVAQRHFGEEGVVVWDAALVLAYFLEKHQEELKLDQGINVVELGAGTGVVGLVAAALGANCTITDLDRLVPLLEETVSLNDHIFQSQKDRLKARPFHWGDNDQAQSFAPNPPDLILLADCIYYEASIQPLIDSLLALSSFKSCPILLSYENRDYYEDKRIIKEKFLDLVKLSFKVTCYQTSDCHEDFAADDIKVLRLDPLTKTNSS